MKAIAYTTYGPPDVLQLREVEKPVPKDDEVLVKVYAASINSWDWDMIRGKPVFVRLWGLVSPRYKIPGADIAGKVEAVGKGVRKFREGDEVFGDLCECGWGGYAEYVCAKENALALKPASMTFEQAAAIPQAGALALQSVYDKGKVRRGQKVLINGAGGGVGTFAVQVARSLGAEVTGVDSAEKLDMLRTLGAEDVIDYKQEDFTENGNRYDVIIDVISGRSIFRYRHSLNPEGKFIMIGGATSVILQAMLMGGLVSKMSGRQIGMLAYKPNKDLDVMVKLFEEGKIVPVIDKCYPLHQTPEAFRYFSEGRVKGKVVITAE